MHRRTPTTRTWTIDAVTFGLVALAIAAWAIPLPRWTAIPSAGWADPQATGFAVERMVDLEPEADEPLPNPTQPCRADAARPGCASA